MSKLNITDQLNSDYKEQLLEMYQHEWWSVGRTEKDVQTILNNASFIIGVIDSENDTLAAFSRILTDHFKYAYVYDVIVKKTYRDQGVGKLLLNTIISHSQLQKIENIELVCRKELIPFYGQFGFSENYGESVAMRRKISMHESN